jgi:hypothetical protein
MAEIPGSINAAAALQPDIVSRVLHKLIGRRHY